MLLRAGADYQARSRRGLTALEWAIWRDELEIARTLLLHNQNGLNLPGNIGDDNINMQDLQHIGGRLGLKSFKGGTRIFSSSDEEVILSIRSLKLDEATHEGDLTRPILEGGARSGYTVFDVYGQFRPPVSKSIWRTYRKAEVIVPKMELLVSTEILNL
jgi:ankyrin repeat protein